MKLTAIVVLMLVSLFPLARAEEASAFKVDQKVLAAIAQLHAGMPEEEVKFTMLPVSVEWGRVHYGGSGRGRLYFQIGKEEQIWVEIGSGPKFLATQIGPVEKKKPWKREGGDSINVQ